MHSELLHSIIGVDVGIEVGFGIEVEVGRPLLNLQISFQTRF